MEGAVHYDLPSYPVVLGLTSESLIHSVLCCLAIFRFFFFFSFSTAPSGSRSSGQSCACQLACIHHDGQRWWGPADPWRPRRTPHHQRRSQQSWWRGDLKVQRTWESRSEKMQSYLVSQTWMVLLFRNRFLCLNLSVLPGLSTPVWMTSSRV